MRQYLFSRYAGPLVGFGGVVAVACLASTWYINRVQAELAVAVRHDAARMQAADDLQVQLRHLRFHSIVSAADPSAARRELVRNDIEQIAATLGDIRRGVATAGDHELAERIGRDFAAYADELQSDRLPPRTSPMTDLARWSDGHRMADLLALCRELADLQRERMNAAVARSESQTTRAGRALIALGLAGALSGVLLGYATARGATRRAARLSVRVQAVQAHLDQEVGTVTVEGPAPAGDLDGQLDRVVGRVAAVCRRLQDQERELLRAEQLAAVGHLAAGVAHEVRNPLTGVKFLIEAALRPANPTPLTTEDLGLMRQEVVRIERTVQGLLDYAKTPPPDRRPHDLGALAADAVAVARGRAEVKSVALRGVAHPGPAPVAGDRDQLLALLTNLLYNAIDATPPGGEVGVCVSPAAGGMLTVDVTDTGPGIDPAFAARLFTPFATTKPTGTGLGLTVARRIAREHGGTLTAANRPGGGACFTLTLPGGAATRSGEG